MPKIRRNLVGILCAAGLFAAGSTTVYVCAPSIDLWFRPNEPLPIAPVQGFYESEISPQGTMFAWTNGHGRIDLRELDRRIPWRLHVKMAMGAWPPQLSPLTARITVDGLELQSVPLGGDFADYEFIIPKHRGRRGLLLGLDSATFTPGESDPRRLGIVVSRLSLWPQAVVWPSPGWLAAALLAGVSVGIGCALAELGLASLAVPLVLLGATCGWLLRPGSREFLANPLAPWHAAWAVVALTALITTTVGVAGRRLPSGLRRTFAKIVVVSTEPLVLLAAVHFSVLALRLPLFTSLPYWRAPAGPKPAGPWYLVVGLLIVPFVAWLLTSRLRRRPALAICALVCSGFLLQQGFAWRDGVGLDGLRGRMRNSGHWEFAVAGVQQSSIWEMLTRYETKVQRGDLGAYAHSKPPGQLLFYMITERLANVWSRGPRDAEARLDLTRTFAAITWPLLSYLALVPLFLLMQELEGRETAFIACLLYLVVPSATLITMHTDQALFPLLFLTTVWLASRAQSTHSLLWAFVTGIALYVIGFFTFTLLLAGIVGVGWAAAVESRRGVGSGPAPALRSLIKTASGIFAGFCVMFLAFAVILNYDFLTRLRGAVAFHQAWKNWRGGIHEIFYFAWLDYLEFAVWLGVPLTVLTLGSLRGALRIVAAGRGRTDVLVWPGISALLVFLYLGFFGHTKAETARLWLPLASVCCGLAAAELRRRYSASLGIMTTVVLTLQWLTVWLIKTGQDLR